MFYVATCQRQLEARYRQEELSNICQIYSFFQWDRQEINAATCRWQLVTLFGEATWRGPEQFIIMAFCNQKHPFTWLILVHQNGARGGTKTGGSRTEYRARCPPNRGANARDNRRAGAKSHSAEGAGTQTPDSQPVKGRAPGRKEKGKRPEAERETRREEDAQSKKNERTKK